jgi:predicted transcriptional regulator
MKDETPALLVIAADVMLPPTHVGPHDDLHTALERFLESGLHELPVVEGGKIVGLLHEAHITRAYHDYLERLGRDVSDATSGAVSTRAPPSMDR